MKSSDAAKCAKWKAQIDDQGKLNRSAERLRRSSYFEDVQVTTTPVPEE